MADYIKRAKRKTNFTTVNNDYLQDAGLSWKGKGLITYIMSLPEEWNLNIADLKNRSKDGRDATAAGIRELIECGYCMRDRMRNESGMFTGYHVSDCKDFERATENTFSVDRVTDNPVAGILDTENPNSENPTLVNTNLNNETLIVNTNDSVKPEPVPSLFPEIEKEKAEQLKKVEAQQLAEEEEKKRKTLFKNSDVYKLVDFKIKPVNYSEFEKYFSGEDYEKVDLVYYFHSVNDWSDQKNMKRTKAGWLATIRNFMRGDVEKNKLHLKAEFKPENQKLDVAGAMDYLNEYD
jgi:hypothetical protein